MSKEQNPEALQPAEKLRDAINRIELGFSDAIAINDLRLAAMELESLHARVQELEDHIAGQGQDDLRTAALQDSAYAAGMLLGWNFCIADDNDTFSKVRGERMTGAVRALKEARAAAPAQPQAAAQTAALLEREAFEAWWRENVSQGLAEIDHDYRYWAIWQARA